MWHYVMVERGIIDGQLDDGEARVMGILGGDCSDEMRGRGRERRDAEARK